MAPPHHWRRVVTTFCSLDSRLVGDWAAMALGSAPWCWAGGALGGRASVGRLFARTALAKAFPNHSTFLLGEIALYSFVTLVVTGRFLTFFFEPSTSVYDGVYVPSRVVGMSGGRIHCQPLPDCDS